MSVVSEKYLVKAQKILDQFNLKSTPLRLGILDIFLKSQNSLSQKEIVNQLSSKLGSVDRISVYRNLLMLKQTGFLHQLEDNQYIACQHQCEHHAHVLLFCLSCKSYQEVSDHSLVKRIENAVSRAQFFSKQSAMTIHGICSTCHS